MADGPRRWQRFNASLTKTYVPDDVSEALSSIPYLHLADRKQLLKISRCQCSPSTNPFLRRQTPMYRSNDLVTIPKSREFSTTHTAGYICRKLSDWVHYNPFRSAILSVLARSAPVFLTREECVRNSEESWWKEINATQSSDRPQILNYDVWFDINTSPNSILGGHLPYAPSVNQRIRGTFFALRDRLVSDPLLLYPQLTTEKRIGRAAAYKFQEMKQSPDITDYGVSVVDLEKYYADTGKISEGPEEMRQSWNYNDLTPRTYYAQSSSSFHRSKYIREIANLICNAFPQTNFVSRYSVNRLVPTERTTCFTYDYSSFTSNLTELKYYLWALASFMAGVPVNVVDSHIGIVETTISDLLFSYIETCVHLPPFMLNRLSPDIREPYIQKKGGHLGQYGNITFSTGLHGLHACNVCGEEGDCNCVGDDVVGFTEVDIDEVMDAVSEMGDIHPQKVKVWPYVAVENMTDEDNVWPYTKRPLDRMENRLNLLPALFLPILGEAISFPGDARCENEDDLRTRIKILVTQVRSVYTALSHLQIEKSEEDLALIHNYLRSLYNALNLKMSGSLPSEICTYRVEPVRGILVPNLNRFYEFDIWAGLEEGFSPGSYNVPVLACLESTPSRGILFTGYTVGRMTRAMNYLHRMGYVEAEVMKHERYFETFDEYKQFFEDLLCRRTVSQYEFRVNYIPEHLHHVVA